MRILEWPGHSDPGRVCQATMQRGPSWSTSWTQGTNHPPQLPPPESEYDGGVGGNTNAPCPNSLDSAGPGGKNPNLRATIKFALPRRFCISSQEPYLLPAAVNPHAQQRAAASQHTGPAGLCLPLCSFISLSCPDTSSSGPALGEEPSVSASYPASIFCPWAEGGR